LSCYLTAKIGPLGNGRFWRILLQKSVEGFANNDSLTLTVSGGNGPHGSMEPGPGTVFTAPVCLTITGACGIVLDLSWVYGELSPHYPQAFNCTTVAAFACKVRARATKR
jgi:hypothetical protein